MISDLWLIWSRINGKGQFIVCDSKEDAELVGFGNNTPFRVIKYTQFESLYEENELLKKQNAKYRDALDNIRLNHAADYDYWDSQDKDELIKLLMELIRCGREALKDE